MKRLFFAFFAITLMASSCSKDSYISPKELFKDSSKVAKTTITTKGEEPETTVSTFKSHPVITKKSDIAGQSHFWASSGGKMVYDAFIISMFFDNIDNLKVGDTISPSRFLFSFVYSSASETEAETHTYEGTISIADKGDDYVILLFDKVGFSCSMGDYLTDGYLYCTLVDS